MEVRVCLVCKRVITFKSFRDKLRDVSNLSRTVLYIVNCLTVVMDKLIP